MMVCLKIHLHRRLYLLFLAMRLPQPRVHQPRRHQNHLMMLLAHLHPHHRPLRNKEME